VEVGGASLCGMDRDIVDGRLSEKSGVELPYTLGHENAGWVREVGSAVSNVAPGDPVIVHPLVTCGLCRPCQTGDDVHCERATLPGVDCDGGMAELLLTHARSVVKLPLRLQPAEVAPFADAGLTAYHAVRQTVPLLYPGTCVVVLGGGGLGDIGLQCLRAVSPAEVVVVDLSEQALAFAGEHGADHTVVVNRQQVEAVRDLTDGLGAHAVLDFGRESASQAAGIAMLRRAGTYFAVARDRAVHIPPPEIVSSKINVVGNLVGSHNDLDELMILAAHGKVHLNTLSYRLEAIGDVLDEFGHRARRGWPVLVPDPA
jgi:NAD+-dependent secondary alcohol dehydrogenase Adh1